MWLKKYKDYPLDRSLIKEKVESGKGIIGCEMHELNGWGETFHQQKLKHALCRKNNKPKTNNEPS